MQTSPVSEELLAVVHAPPERQEQLLKLARAMAESLDSPAQVEAVAERPEPSGRTGRLSCSSRRARRPGHGPPGDSRGVSGPAHGTEGVKVESLLERYQRRSQLPPGPGLRRVAPRLPDLSPSSPFVSRVAARSGTRFTTPALTCR